MHQKGHMSTGMSVWFTAFLNTHNCVVCLFCNLLLAISLASVPKHNSFPSLKDEKRLFSSLCKWLVLLHSTPNGQDFLGHSSLIQLKKGQVSQPVQKETCSHIPLLINIHKFVLRENTTSRKLQRKHAYEHLSGNQHHLGKIVTLFLHYLSNRNILPIPTVCL